MHERRSRRRSRRSLANPGQPGNEDGHRRSTAAQPRARNGLALKSTGHSRPTQQTHDRRTRHDTEDRNTEKHWTNGQIALTTPRYTTTSLCEPSGSVSFFTTGSDLLTRDKHEPSVNRNEQQSTHKASIRVEALAEQRSTAAQHAHRRAKATSATSTAGSGKIGKTAKDESGRAHRFSANSFSAWSTFEQARE